jgi:uncharacterized protein (DUF58 family)
VGLALGWREMVVLGLAGILTFCLAMLFALLPHAHDLSFRLAADRVVAGQGAGVIVTVVNPTGHRLAALEVDIPVGEDVITRSVGRLPARGEVQLSFAIDAPVRGVVTVGPARVVRQDPLGLVSREVSHGVAATLFVHPVTVGLASMSSGFVRDLEGTPTRDLTDNDLSFHALREYVPGDDRRNIHWKSTAKTGQFMVRQFEQSRRSHLLIALDTALADFADSDEFELAVSVAASLGVRALRDTRDLSVLRGASPSKPRSATTAVIATVSRSTLLDGLAGVHAEVGSPGLLTLAKMSAGHSADVSVGFLVTGSVPSAKTIHAASVTFPAGVEVVVIVCEPEAAPGMRLLGRLSVMTIGRLDDITQILGRKKAVS